MSSSSIGDDDLHRHRRVHRTGDVEGARYGERRGRVAGVRRHEDAAVQGFSSNLGQPVVATGPDDVHIVRVVDELDGLAPMYPQLCGGEPLVVHADGVARCLHGYDTHAWDESTSRD